MPVPNLKAVTDLLKMQFTLMAVDNGGQATYLTADPTGRDIITLDDRYERHWDNIEKAWSFFSKKNGEPSQ